MFQTSWSRRITMLWQSTSGYIRHYIRYTSALPATHYCWCRYAKVWAIAMFLSSSQHNLVIEWWNLLGLMRSLLKKKLQHQMLPLYNMKTWLLPCLCPLQTIIMYQYDAWSWIRIWVNVVLKLFISEHGKVLYSSSLDNDKFNLLRSLAVTKPFVQRRMSVVWVLRASAIHRCYVPPR